jgi:hypothetical protein
MAKQDITPDSLAKKTFLITFFGAILYIVVVFVFVIGGNKDIDNSASGVTPKMFTGHSDSVHAAPAHAEGHHP